MTDGRTVDSPTPGVPLTTVDGLPAWRRLVAIAGKGDTRAWHLGRAAAVGLLAGLVAVAFRWALTVAETGRAWLILTVRGWPMGPSLGWIVLPVIGLIAGSVVGWLVIRFAPDAPGSGIPHVKGVLLHIRQMRWKGLLPIKFVGGVIGIGAGLSLGREGPTVQMGAAVGKAMASLLRVPSRTIPQLISCGAGAGIAAAFNAPLAGFLFVLEELHRELSARTFGGALVAALSADIVARALSGDLPSFSVTGFSTLPLGALPVAVVIGVVGGAMGVLFNRALLSGAEATRRVTAVPRWLMCGLACALCGLVAWWLPDAVGGGHSTAERLLGGEMQRGLWAMALLLAVKFLLTIVSYASGAPGGIFAPMLLMGAIVGCVLGRLSAGLVPSLGDYGTAMSILGMAAWFTGSVRAPLTGIVLLVEMTGSYQQLLPLAVACLLADLTAGALRDTPIYEALLEADIHRQRLAGTPLRPGDNDDVAEPRTIYVAIQRGSRMEGYPLRSCGIPAGCLVVGVERAGRELLPSAGLIVLAGDQLTVVVPEDEAEKSLDVIRLATGD